ncbi:hypothetical protein [Marmoricola sp. RAF53]|uniref:hypothetical protein n=1 Tax=Marmoricola sp. RAF53 TaxID=3233059 RepID=UPI003F98A3DF
MRIGTLTVASLAMSAAAAITLPAPAGAATDTVHFTFEVRNTNGRVIGNADWVSATAVRFNDVYVYDYCPADSHGEGAYAELTSSNGQSFGRNWINSAGCDTSKHWENVTLSRTSAITSLRVALCASDGTELTSDCNISFVHNNPYA